MNIYQIILLAVSVVTGIILYTNKNEYNIFVSTIHKLSSVVFFVWFGISFYNGLENFSVSGEMFIPVAVTFFSFIILIVSGSILLNTKKDDLKKVHLFSAILFVANIVLLIK